MASPQLVAVLEDVVVRFRRYAREKEPRLVWTVIAELNGLRSVEKAFAATLKAEVGSGSAAREVVALLTVQADARGGTLVAAGKVLELPASEPDVSEVFAAIIRLAFEKLDDLAPATAPHRG